MKKRTKVIICISIIVIVITVFAFFRIQYGGYYETRNYKQDSIASSLHKETNYTLEKILEEGIEIPQNFTVSSSKKYSDDFKSKETFLAYLDDIAQKCNTDYKSGYWYIEIRGYEVYRILYARWFYSGFVGQYPGSIWRTDPYAKVVEEYYTEFEQYTQE